MPEVLANAVEHPIGFFQEKESKPAEDSYTCSDGIRRPAYLS
jgi:hypothetical protein